MKQSVRGGEGHAVIAADVVGQSALLKQPFKHGEGTCSTEVGGRRKAALP